MEGDFPDSFRSVHRLVHVVAAELEAGAKELADLRLVIDDQDAVVGIWHFCPLDGARTAHPSRVRMMCSLYGLPYIWVLFRE
jgi:hypothetical protein